LHRSTCRTRRFRSGPEAEKKEMGTTAALRSADSAGTGTGLGREAGWENLGESEADRGFHQ